MEEVKMFVIVQTHPGYNPEPIAVFEDEEVAEEYVSIMNDKQFAPWEQCYIMPVPYLDESDLERYEEMSETEYEKEKAKQLAESRIHDN